MIGETKSNLIDLANWPRIFSRTLIICQEKLFGRKNCIYYLSNWHLFKNVKFPTSNFKNEGNSKIHSCTSTSVKIRLENFRFQMVLMESKSNHLIVLIPCWKFNIFIIKLLINILSKKSIYCLLWRYCLFSISIKEIQISS